VNTVLDAGALIAVDRGDRRMAARLQVAQRMRIPLRTSAAAVAQAWRHPRQVNLARLLSGVAVEPLGPGEGRQIGQLLAATGSTDIVDAHVALLVELGGTVLTSDPDGLRRLLAGRGVTAAVVAV